MYTYRAVIRKGGVITVIIDADTRWEAANKLCLSLHITDADILSLVEVEKEA